MARPIPREAPVTTATRSWSGKDGVVVGVGAVLAALLVSEAIITKKVKNQREREGFLSFQYKSTGVRCNGRHL